MRASRRLLAAASVALLAACGALTTQPPRQNYLCEQGGSFMLQVGASGEQAVIDIDDMQFVLLREAGRPEAYSCSMLRVVRSGDTATVELEGRPSHTGCRLQPARR